MEMFRIKYDRCVTPVVIEDYTDVTFVCRRPELHFSSSKTSELISMRRDRAKNGVGTLVHLMEERRHKA